jgi:hypothetical protein
MSSSEQPKAVANQEIEAYLKALIEKFDVVLEHPDKFWEVIVNIAEQGDQLPDVTMVVTKEEYRRLVGRLVSSMVRATAAYMKGQKR